MIILELLPFISAVTSGASAANLFTPEPKEIWTAGDDDPYIYFDFGQPRTFDSLFLGFTNAPANATWGIYGFDLVEAPELLFNGAFRAADSLGPRHHGFVRLPAPKTYRYIQFNLNWHGTDLEAGIVMAGLAIQGAYEYGSGRQAIDTGSREARRDGGFGIGRGVVKAGLRWTFPDLSPAVRRALWALVKSSGTTSPVVVVEELDEDAGLGEEIHYGLFDSFEAYERTAPGMTRWALSMTEWT